MPTYPKLNLQTHYRPGGEEMSNITVNSSIIGKDMIRVNYSGVEECREKLKDICNRIDSIMMNKLVMDESQGEMADALQAQYECMQDILRQLRDLIDNISTAVGGGAEAFKEKDAEIAKKFGNS